jgi:two-component system cell cycle sensor histidine kinase/response regulator CckA
MQSCYLEQSPCVVQLAQVDCRPEYQVFLAHDHSVVDTASGSFPSVPPCVAEDGCHILLVDDERAVRRYAARILEQDGHTVYEAADGVEALELLESGALPVELVVSDIIMPRLNGVELLKALAVTHPAVPVILMSAYAQGELSEKGVVAPCGVLPKPFPAERLIQEVRRCLSRRG